MGVNFWSMVSSHRTVLDGVSLHERLHFSIDSTNSKDERWVGISGISFVCLGTIDSKGGLCLVKLGWPFCGLVVASPWNSYIRRALHNL